MQSIESFTALADLLDRPRRVRFDGLTGLIIEGLTPNEAKLAVMALEALDKRSLVAIAQGHPVGPLETPSAAPPAQPDGSPNRAQWQPAEVRHTRAAPARDAQETPERTEPEPVAGEIDAKPAEPDDGVPEPPTVGHPDPMPDPEPVTVAPDASDDEIAAALIENTERNMPDPMPEQPAPKPKRRKGPKKAPPRVKDLPKLPEAGDQHEGSDIIAVKDHSDGGRLLIRADGVRVKVDDKGTEIARSDTPPPDVSDVPSAADLQTPPESAKEERVTYPVPEAILQTRMTRDVVQHLVQHGVTDKDRIIAECLKLKDQGALAFQASKDEEAVRRRVTSTLTVMGRS
jgi:hypothetical protein